MVAAMLNRRAGSRGVTKLSLTAQPGIYEQFPKPIRPIPSPLTIAVRPIPPVCLPEAGHPVIDRRLSQGVLQHLLGKQSLGVIADEDVTCAGCLQQLS